jgi:hypothetical protein
MDAETFSFFCAALPLSALAVVVRRRQASGRMWLALGGAGLLLVLFVAATGWASSGESPLWVAIAALVSMVIGIGCATALSTTRGVAVQMVAAAIAGVASAFAAVLASYLILVGWM